MIYFCCEEGRRSLVRSHPTLNGIDYLEVVHREEPVLAEKQRKLRVFFVKPPDAALLSRFGPDKFANTALVRVTGGQRTPRIAVDWAAWVGDHLEIHVTPRGDFSRYKLSLVEPTTTADQPLQELDVLLAAVDFSFKVECESDFDCRVPCPCPPTSVLAADLDYLAKDYASFRQLMLDRISLLAPEWRERNPADLGVALIELLAYVGDYLSYRQDAAATEAYIGTALRRVSLRRHAKLLDYSMHDGCNARAWVQVRVQESARKGVVLPLFSVVDQNGRFLREESTRPVLTKDSGEFLQQTRFITRLSESRVLAEHEFQRLAAAVAAEVFEPMERATLFPEHNELHFHTWGAAVCCLPAGATKATLKGKFPNLRRGQVLIFVERLGPKTGNPADANPLHRHAVRLTKVEGRTDPVFAPPVEVTEIEWEDTDALPMPFCLSARAEQGGQLLSDVSIALGNIVLADHGMTLARPEDLPRVPAPRPELAPARGEECGHCHESQRLPTPARFRPRLAARPLTQVAPYDSARPAVEAFAWEMQEVLPAVYLTDRQGRLWTPRHDLLSSDAFAPEFVVESENDGRALLRFGDDENGMSPGEGTELWAFYRVGNGVRGNLGAESLVQFVADTVLVPDNVGVLQPQSPASAIDSVWNPLPARRGTAPEALEDVRNYAPAAFRVQQRAVTPSDYAEKAGMHPDVQTAAATLRWTGSWYTIFLTVDRRGGRLVDAAFEEDLRRYLERYRMAGHDLEIDGPSLVPLELEMRVCVTADYFQSDVIAALQATFDNRLHADGSLGFFHPDNFTFGQPVLLSRIYAAAQRVAGVRHVEVTVLRRQGETTGPAVPSDDRFAIGRLEIARLDNDPNFPDRGELRFLPVGGR